MTIDASMIAILGLGEAGRAFARDLVRSGVRVRAFDPDPRAVPEGVHVCSSVGEAVRDAEVIVALVWAEAALEVAREAVSHLGPAQLYADASTAHPMVKKAIASTIGSSGAACADVALLGPVPGTGMQTEAVVSGSGAGRYAAWFGRLGVHPRVVGDEAGAASQTKLVGSILLKGVASVLLESLEVARALGIEDALLDRARRVVDPNLVDRFIASTHAHAARRTSEMEAAATLCREAGVEPVMTDATLRSLRRLAAHPHSHAPHGT